MSGFDKLVELSEMTEGERAQFFEGVRYGVGMLAKRTREHREAAVLLGQVGACERAVQRTVIERSPRHGVEL